MWRRIYLLLVLFRLYFALSPSYLHPDEHFQGPEIIAANVFNFKPHATWEFTSADPIRSIFPLWLVYGCPLTVLKWAGGRVPTAIYYTLRILMFLLSFVLQDSALYELLTIPQQRRTAILLVSSSYVTWTWQSHTFSNSIETLIVLWCLVLVKRLKDVKSRHFVACTALAFLSVLGTFNRITFPAFVVVPLFGLLPFFRAKPVSLLVTVAAAIVTTLLAVTVDSKWYGHRVFTPWNNLMYNLDASNLAQHGLHPRWQHVLVNLPQLLGPAYLCIFTARRSLPFWSAASGVFLLSIFQHQEARFLLPAVPLLLASINVRRQAWIVIWAAYNVLLGILMGTYHQGGVVPASLWLSDQKFSQAIWWKTLSPPNYLAPNITTIDLMGMPGEQMATQLRLSCDKSTVLVAPLSATYLDSMNLRQIYTYRRHVNLDDLDFENGILPTLNRIIERRGLGVFEIPACHDFSDM